MKLSLSQRVTNLTPSPTLSITARVKTLIAAGQDIIGLGAGEPDFDTPEFVKQAAIKAIEQGFTKYTAVDGTPSLKHAIIEKFRRDNGLTYTAEQILVSNGGKHSFYNLAQALLETGDEAIIPAPYWVSYPPMVALAGAKPIIIDAPIEQDFKITPQQLADTITPHTKLLILNSPCNPTGAVYSQSELTALGSVLAQHPNILIVTDDIYESIVWQQTPCTNILSVCPHLYDQTIVLNGVSKTYSMTGWRIGYAAGPEPLIHAMKAIQSQSTSNPSSISQVAAETALLGDQTCITTMVDAFMQRHTIIHQRLNQLKQVTCKPAQGAFYLFPDFRQVIKNTPNINNDVELAEWLLEQTRVALIPGSAFGAPGFMRLSFATSLENLNNAMDRLEKHLNTSSTTPP